MSKQKLNSFDSWYSYLLDGRINGSKNMFMSVTRMLKLPRNYGFVQRLPQKFALKVLKKGNTTGGGCWYYVEINGHELNLFSEAVLEEGDLLEIEKEGDRILKILARIEKAIQNSEPDKKIDFSA